MKLSAAERKKLAQALEVLEAKVQALPSAAEVVKLKVEERRAADRLLDARINLRELLAN